jgi:hypothetical protein
VVDVVPLDPVGGRSRGNGEELSEVGHAINYNRPIFWFGLSYETIIMTEELSYELYKWLSGLEVVPATLRYKPNGNYELDSKSTEGLLNGSLLARLLHLLAAESGAIIN